MQVNLPIEEVDECDVEIFEIISGQPKSPKLKKYFKYDGNEKVVDKKLFRQMYEDEEDDD